MKCEMATCVAVSTRVCVCVCACRFFDAPYDGSSRCLFILDSRRALEYSIKRYRDGLYKTAFIRQLQACSTDSAC